jgi:peptidoglycan/LPS O-acetylase OafA/YrhL
MRLASLDLLRVTAVVMVLLRHMTPESDSPWVRALCAAGWAGVDLFFVLSGYLIAALLIAEVNSTGRLNLSRFYWRRGLKIYPSFLLLLAIYGPMEYFLGENFTLLGFIGELTFTQNYVGHIFNHTWSLAVEEHFYLLISLLVYTLATCGRLNLLPWIAFAVLAACLASRCAIQGLFGRVDIYASHLRMDSLMAGVLVACCRQYRPDLAARVRVRHCVYGMLALLPLFVWPPESGFFSTAGFTLNYCAFAVVVLAAINSEQSIRSSRFARAAASVGTYSYTIYLWHMFAKRFLSAARKSGLVHGWWFELIAYSTLSIIVGYVAAMAIERPVLMIRDRLFPCGRERRESVAK